MRGNYDAVAGFYDPLSRLVFGRSIYHAHLFLLQAIPAKSRVLIVGGGSGWLLEEIAHLHPAGLHITYVELSEKMMAASRNRPVAQNTVFYVREAIQEVAFSQPFDVVITPFLFDNFSERTLRAVFEKIDKSLCRGGLWLNADFEVPRNNCFHAFLLKSMYFFFRYWCRIEASQLPDLAAQFKAAHYHLQAEKLFYNKFIKAMIYQKPAVL